MRTALVLLLTLSAPFAPAAEVKAQKHALLVGVKTYSHRSLSDLNYTENDVEELARLLARPASGFTSVRVLTTTRGARDKKDAPTAANIRAALKGLLTSRGKGDLVLLALSGHGVVLEVADPAGQGEKKPFPYFCPSDADLLGVNYTTGHSDHLINLNSLFADLGRCGAGSKLVLIDACRNTLKVTGAQRSIDANKVTVPEGVSALFSCSPGQVAWETGKLGKGHGVFFYHVLKGLRGEARDRNGEVSWDGLKAYVRREVPRQVKTVIGQDTRQVPNSVENSTDEPPVLVPAGAFAGGGEPLYLRAFGLYHGTSGQLDWPQAARLAKQAAEKDDARAQAMLGWMLSTGAGGKRDAEAAKVWATRSVPALRKAAADGDAHAQAWLGSLLGTGLGVDRDRQEALQWHRKAAAKGHVRAQNALGLAYRDGVVGDKDEKEAAAWLRKAADGKCVFARLNLADLYWAGRGVAKDEEQAFAWRLKAAEQGHPAGENWVGWMYERGRGVEKDEAVAARWYRKAAEKGNAVAQTNLGLAHVNGRGVEKSDEEALKWFQKAAALNFPRAQHLVGYAYASGRGVTQDDAQAVAWYRKAAERGFAEGQNSLGFMYDHGRGVDKDQAEAVRWYKKAADQGHALAQANLALAYENGRGVEKDLAEARYWYKKAAAGGNERAKKALERLTGNGKPPPFKGKAPPKPSAAPAMIGD